MTTATIAAKKAVARSARSARSEKAEKAAYAPLLLRVYDKVSGACLGYLVQPEVDAAATYYRVQCDARGVWHCTCCGNAEFHRQCKHINAVKADCERRVAEGLPGCYQGRDQAVAEAAEVAMPVRRTARLTGMVGELLEGSTDMAQHSSEPTEHRIQCVCGHERVVGPVFTAAELARMATEPCSDCTAIKEVVILRDTPARHDPDAVPLRGNRGFSLFKRPA